MGPSIDSCWRRLLSCPKSMLESKYCMDELKKTHRFKWNPMVVQTVCSFSVVVNKAAEWSKTENKNHGDWRRQIVIKLISSAEVHGESIAEWDATRTRDQPVRFTFILLLLSPFSLLPVHGVGFRLLVGQHVFNLLDFMQTFCVPRGIWMKQQWIRWSE